ncbi:hypothetical protein BC830DRAFT_1088721 [Chytriomyces sp. MP71]|nr:hypothetical protein BC830DRAFT_1088721 [Chytriomyces sp. MP71]
MSGVGDSGSSLDERDLSLAWRMQRNSSTVTQYSDDDELDEDEGGGRRNAATPVPLLPTAKLEVHQSFKPVKPSSVPVPALAAASASVPSVSSPISVTAVQSVPSVVSTSRATSDDIDGDNTLLATTGIVRRPSLLFQFKSKRNLLASSSSSSSSMVVSRHGGDNASPTSTSDTFPAATYPHTPTNTAHKSAALSRTQSLLLVRRPLGPTPTSTPLQRSFRDPMGQEDARSLSLSFADSASSTYPESNISVSSFKSFASRLFRTRSTDLDHDASHHPLGRNQRNVRAIRHIGSAPNFAFSSPERNSPSITPVSPSIASSPAVSSRPSNVLARAQLHSSRSTSDLFSLRHTSTTTAPTLQSPSSSTASSRFVVQRSESPLRWRNSSVTQTPTSSTTNIPISKWMGGLFRPTRASSLKPVNLTNAAASAAPSIARELTSSVTATPFTNGPSPLATSAVYLDHASEASSQSTLSSVVQYAADPVPGANVATLGGDSPNSGGCVEFPALSTRSSLYASPVLKARGMRSMESMKSQESRLREE